LTAAVVAPVEQPAARATRGAFAQVTTLLGGAVLAQAIALAASPLLTRLFTPEHFGAFALFFSAVAWLATVATGRYEWAILVPPQEAQARQLIRLAMLLSSAVSLLVLLLWLMAAALRWAGAALPALPLWTLLLPLSTWLTAAYAVASNWANRQQAYVALARSRVLQSGLTAATSALLGLAAWGTAGLVWGAVLGQALAVAVLWRSAFKQGSASLTFDMTELKATARRFAEFPRINLPHALLDATQSAAVLGLLGAAYGGVALGSYAFALRVVRAPLAMVGASVGQVFQQRAAQLLHSQGNARPLLRKTAWRLLAIAAPFVLLMAFAPALFAWVFGPDWRQAGECAWLLTPWMVASFLTSPFSVLPSLTGQLRQAFWWGLAYQAAMVLPLALAWALGLGWMPALAWQSALTALLLVGYGAWLWRLAGCKPVAAASEKNG
jgi:O-antigen/teichoic acid export membrane protein